MSNLVKSLREDINQIIRDETRWLRHYPAQVVDIDDELEKGRVKVTIPELGFDTADQGLWCNPRQGNSLSVPLVDEWVEIYFMAGNPERPVYLHYPTEVEGMVLKNYTGNPVLRIIFESPETEENIKYDDESKTLTITVEALEIVTQAEVTKLEMNSSGIKLITGDASTWKPNSLTNDPFTGAPHFTSVLLTGG